MATHNAYSQSPVSYPIPSYDVLINGRAIFQESYGIAGNNTDGKKTISVISAAYNTIAPKSITVYVYSLDGLSCLGPFSFSVGQSFYIEVDNRNWGVQIQTIDLVEISVFID